MTEYLLRLLNKKFPVAVLSRGYRRRTKGFLIAENNSTSWEIGDEPKQLKNKFSDIIVAVDGNRRRGIKKLFSQFSELKVILLDDAFQHRRIKAGLTILLTDYNNPFYGDFLLPVGRLREGRAGKKRADIIVITKCPQQISHSERNDIIKRINPLPHQKVFFSYLEYSNPVALYGNKEIKEMKEYEILLLTGIADPMPLENFLSDRVRKIIPFHYPDHHDYTSAEVMRLVNTFNNIASSEKIIITTEKDAMRLDKPGLMEQLKNISIYHIPIEITFNEKEEEEFNKLVTDYVVRANQKHG